MKLLRNNLPNILILGLFAALVSCKDSNVKIGPAYTLGDTSEAIVKAESKHDPFAESLQTEVKSLVGHDDLIFDSARKLAYASGMDGWIWKVDLSSGKAEQWVKPPVNPAGMQYGNSNKDKIVFCASKLGGETYEDSQKVGLYEVDTVTREIVPLVLNLPRTEKDEFDKVYTTVERRAFSLKDLNDGNSRPFALCNDLAISNDGKRIYITEPFERDDAAMGPGAVPEAIGLYPHGKLWLYDRSKNSITLVLTGFTFVDGILLEEKAGKDESVVFTETTKFRIIRAFFTGDNAGKHEVLFDNLPGLADGLEWDAQGRMWTGLIKPRSGLVNFIHKNPWIKPLLLALPQKLLPIAHKTGILVIDSSGKEALYYVMHDGSKINDISVVVPFGDKIYFPSFDKEARGLHSMGVSNLGLK